MLRNQSHVEGLLICFLDMLFALISALIVLQFPYNSLTGSNLITFMLVHVFAYYISNIYNHMMIRGKLDEALAVVIYNFDFIVALCVMAFFTRDSFMIGRKAMIAFFIINNVTVYIGHMILKFYHKKLYPKRMSSNKIYLVTTKSRVERILKHIREFGGYGGDISAIAILDDNLVGTYLDDIEVVADQNTYLDYATYNVVDEVFVHLPDDYEIDLDHLLQEFEDMGAAVSLNINAYDREIPTDKILRHICGFNVITFTTKIYDLQTLVIKRCMDICGALVGLIITGVVMLFLAPIIKLESKGPVIFAQDRVGKNGRIFKFYKFRSMYVDAEERKKELMEQNEMKGLMFKMRDDPRITKVGKFIRRTSLDELPQFFNVLKGDMSLIGTRPPTLDEYQHYKYYQKRRLSAKPGITGLWQVSGRNEITEFDDVIKMDLEYIDHWNLWLDVRILCKTIKAIFSHRGAS